MTESEAIKRGAEFAAKNVKNCKTVAEGIEVNTPIITEAFEKWWFPYVLFKDALEVMRTDCGRWTTPKGLIARRAVEIAHQSQKAAYLKAYFARHLPKNPKSLNPFIDGASNLSTYENVKLITQMANENNHDFFIDLGASLKRKSWQTDVAIRQTKSDMYLISNWVGYRMRDGKLKLGLCALPNPKIAMVLKLTHNESYSSDAIRKTLQRLGLKPLPHRIRMQMKVGRAKKACVRD